MPFKGFFLLLLLSLTSVAAFLNQPTIASIPKTVQFTSRSTLLASSTGEDSELFKAGLLANSEEDAGVLASKKIRSLKDLGWRGPAKRRGNIRPRHWAFGGANEQPVQSKYSAVQ